MGKSKSGMAPVPVMVSVLLVNVDVTFQCRQLFSPKSPEVAAVVKLLMMASVSRSGISNSSLSCLIFSLMIFSAISFFFASKSSKMPADAFTVRPENSPTTRTRHSASESTRFFIVSSSFVVMRVYNRNTYLSKIYHMTGKVCNGYRRKNVLIVTFCYICVNKMCIFSCPCVRDPLQKRGASCILAV